MEFGVHPIFMTSQAVSSESPWDYISNVARQAEDMGYTYFAPGDRMARSLDTTAILIVAAGATTRMKLATSVMVLPPRGPVAAATFFSALNILSGGRAIAGVGTSSQFRDYAVVGMDHDEMWPRFEEAVRTLRTYLTPESKPFTGKFYNTEGYTLEPVAPQKSQVPIWIGSWGSDAGLRRVARLADGWLGSAGPGHQSPEQFALDKKRLDGFLIERGKDPETFPNAVSSMQMFISDDKEELERIGAPAMGPGGGQAPTGGGVTRPAERPFEDEHAHDMIGTRAQCIDKVRRWQAAGVQALFFAPRGPDPMGQLRIFMDEVAAKA